MLHELSIHNLVILERATVQPGLGLTVISGETGAGKSLLLDALGVVLGARASARLVGPAADAATVSASFVDVPQRVRDLAAEAGIHLDDDHFILRRRLAASGRSQAWINDQPVAVATLRNIGQLLVDVRVQHEHLRLADVGHQLNCLDRFGGHAETANAYAACFRACNAIEHELAELEHAERDSVRELDYLRFLVAEIDELDPQPGELASLEARQRLLAGASEWLALAGAATEALTGESGASELLGRWAQRLADAPDEGLKQAAEACSQALECAREAGFACAAALDRLHADPAELARIDQRLAAWQDILRKHGNDEAAIWTARDHSQARIDQLEHLDQRRVELQQALVAKRQECSELGTQLANKRQTAFKRLAAVVHAELAELGMPKAQLTLHHEPRSQPTANGNHDQWLVVQTNPGLPAGTIGELASGGESARLTLALAVALATADDVPVLVFDEVDAGVGGRLGAIMGRKLRELAATRSVIAVTHTPQLAAAAHSNYLVSKSQGHDSTAVTIGKLTGTELVLELADMLGGGTAAHEQALALLDEGRPSA